MIQEIVHQTEEKMKKAVEVTRHEFSLFRTGRANPGILEHIRVDAYGSLLPLIQVAAVTVPDPRMLLITPFDRNLLSHIEKAILKSDVGITPGNDGAAIRLHIPALNEQRRKEIVKQVHHRAEVGRASLRTVRHEAIKHLQNDKKTAVITEDDEKRAEDQVQKLVDKYIHEIDQLIKAKETELMEV